MRPGPADRRRSSCGWPTAAPGQRPRRSPATVFREASAHAVSETRAFTERATPVVEALRRLANDGLVLDDADRLARQLLAFLQSNPGLSWVSYSDEAGTFTGAYRTADGQQHIKQTRIVNGKTPTARVRCSARRHLASGEAGVRQRLRSARPAVVHEDQGGRPARVAAAVHLLRPGRSGHYLRRSGAGPDGPVPGRGDRRLRPERAVRVRRPAVASARIRDSSCSRRTRRCWPTRPSKWSAPQGSGRPASCSPWPTSTIRWSTRFAAELSGRPTPGRRRRSRSSAFEFDHDGTEYLASTTAFRVGDDQVWVVGAVAPKADFLADVWRSQAHRPHGRGRGAARRGRAGRPHGPVRFQAGADADRVHEPRRRRRPGRQGRRSAAAGNSATSPTR